MAVNAINDIGRPLLHFLVNASDIFAQNPQADQLHSTEKKEADRQGRETRQVIAHN